MRTSKYSVEQIIGFLREAQGSHVAEVSRRHNVSATSFYKWRQQYGGMEVDEARRLKALEAENGRLKRLVADQAVKIQILEEVNSKKWQARRPSDGRCNMRASRTWGARCRRVRRCGWRARRSTGPAR